MCGPGRAEERENLSAVMNLLLCRPPMQIRGVFLRSVLRCTGNHCWACSSSSVVLGSPKEAATTLTIDGTSHVQGYDCTVASAACSAAQGSA